ncbi:hypothetical protein EMIHUDRAFT_95110 [Emiliania huxleyi CCMP1516]|uniref:Apple domain-containing protein n=2 Tax=Emiliania huxleyi TaxID=2903 RepID=A0A0D3L1N1_EMIH1|nr:hypothetical protein EMIHUDRAFT_95110 [Emiliania huxleyi CCMP1516]EOD41916.1 hypothetical protein EMIHUDRAFT_95110 [Emiliania huxleyi CCMP1516]|eukprot:XP_005794345.1 hypothetical protein EMIHUDRAFT_95110 [Emiliania huxleyi CCMP1516]
MEHESLRLRAAVVYALTLAAQPACGQQLGSTFQRRFILGRGACATPGGGQGSYSEVWELSHERCAEACLNDRECVAYEYSTTKRYKLCEKHKEVPSHSVPVDNSACFVLESALSLRTFKPFRGGDARYRGAVSAAGPLGWPPPPPAIVVPPRACGSPSSMPSSMPSSSSGGDGFAGCDLRLVQWDGLSVESVNLDGADLSGGSFTRAQFFRSTLRATFVRTNLSRATFRGANLEGADFTLARGTTPSTFDMARGHFKAPDPAASQVKAGCAALPAFGASYPGCDLRARSWDGVNLEQARDRPERPPGADLRGASLNSARLDDADLTKADLVGAELTEASLRRADFRMSQLGAAKAEEADFSDAVAEKALFEGAAAPRAQFARARLAESQFNGARLVGASFAKADLVGASFKDAAVEGVDFTGALMDVATDFTGAIGVDKVAAWPAGYSPPLG